MADEAPSLQAQVQPNQAHLGDLVTLDVRVTHPAAISVLPPTLTKELGTFEVYASTQLAQDRSGPQWVDHYQALLQDFTTGQQVLPGIDVSYYDAMGKVGHLKTPPLTVTITEVPPGPKDKGDIRGIKGVIGPVAWSPWWWLLVIGIGMGAGFWAWKQRKQKIMGPPPPPPIPPDEAALKKLRELESLGWLEAGKIKEFYSAVSDIIRAYIEGAFSTPALERTTSELMRTIRRHPAFQSLRQEELRELLEECDLVKFAKYRPDPEDGRKLLAVAIKFVEETTDKNDASR